MRTGQKGGGSEGKRRLPKTKFLQDTVRLASAMSAKVDK